MQAHPERIHVEALDGVFNFTYLPNTVRFRPTKKGLREEFSRSWGPFTVLRFVFQKVHSRQECMIFLKFLYNRCSEIALPSLSGSGSSRRRPAKASVLVESKRIQAVDAFGGQTTASETVVVIEWQRWWRELDSVRSSQSTYHSLNRCDGAARWS